MCQCSNNTRRYSNCSVNNHFLLWLYIFKFEGIKRWSGSSWLLCKFRAMSDLSVSIQIYIQTSKISVTRGLFAPVGWSHCQTRQYLERDWFSFLLHNWTYIIIIILTKQKLLVPSATSSSRFQFCKDETPDLSRFVKYYKKTDKVQMK